MLSRKIDKENIPQAIFPSGEFVGKQNERRLSLALYPQCVTKLQEVITLDSSDEIIDTSLQESPKVFDWIKTPRLNKNQPDLDRKSINSPLVINHKTVKSGKADEIISRNGFSTPINTCKLNKDLLNTGKKYENSLFGNSKRRNVEQWLEESQPHTHATTDPLEPKVLEVLRSVYGKNWSHEKKRIKVDPKSEKHNRGCKTDMKVTDKAVSRRLQKGSFSVNSKLKSPTNSSASTKSNQVNVSNKAIKKIVFDSESPIPSRPISVPPDEDDLLRMPDSPCFTPKPPDSRKHKKRRRERSLSDDDVASTPSARSIGVAAVCATPKRTFLASLNVSSPTSISHPDALDYKINFMNKKDELCQRLFKLYNSEVFEERLPSDMQITWNPKMRGTAGYCYNKKITRGKEVTRAARIELASRVIDRADRLRDTLIHELCHAAAWVVDGVIDGHGSIWSHWAQQAMSRFPELPSIKRCHNYQIASKYTYRCSSCEYSINRNSKSIDLTRKRCGHCGGTLELFVNKKRRGKTEQPEFDQTRTIRPANAFALFVKENYKRIKDSEPDRKHGDVMKILSNQYSVFKSVVTPGKK